MQFKVFNRFSGDLQFTAEIECKSNASTSVKLGLAVRWAQLSGADLSDANLSGAVLSRADLSGANLSRANLIVAGNRSDGYSFYAIREKSGEVMVKAGCRYFTIKEARAHWKKTRGGTRLGKESLALVAHIVTMAKIAGWKP